MQRFIASYCIQAPCQSMKISSPGSRKPNVAETGREKLTLEQDCFLMETA